jgi:hypothetical protein
VPTADTDLIGSGLRDSLALVTLINAMEALPASCRSTTSTWNDSAASSGSRSSWALRGYSRVEDLMIRVVSLVVR